MWRIKHDEDLADIPLPCDYFDLIGGTSTGGYVIDIRSNTSSALTPKPLPRIIALMLGRLRMSVGEAIEDYGTLAQRVFSDPRLIGGDGKFKARNLEDAIKEIVEKKAGRADEPMIDPRPDACKTYASCPD
jgi:hypothetical protein